MKIKQLMAAVAAIVLLVPAVADARAGGGTNTGSRGNKTNQAPPPTQTAPTAKPIERSATPTQQAQAPRPATSAAQPSFFQRHPFLSGLMGGVLGAGLIDMLFGGGFGGAAGLFGLLIQAALIGGLVFLVLRLVRGRAGMPGAGLRPAYAGATPSPVDAPIARST